VPGYDARHSKRRKLDFGYESPFMVHLIVPSNKTVRNGHRNAHEKTF
jgi:hypothetical protein